MTEIKRPLLITALINPKTTCKFNLSQWDLLIRQARRAGVLARIGGQLECESLLVRVPEQALHHIRSAQLYAEQFRISLHWEVQCVEKTLNKLGIPVILLKGTAYEMAGNQAAMGRVFSDVDILVAKKYLQQVENAMMLAGWLPCQLDDYDKKYYRKWMHEIPALQHITRRTTIDVHHNILPETCTLCPDAEELLNNTIKLKNNNIYILSSEDRVLHSASHLFHEGEFDHGFRDISDLDLLIREFSSQLHFWDNLINRSIKLKQQIPLYYALRYTSQILATPIPKKALTASEKVASGKIKQVLMDFLFLRALLPDHSSCDDSWTGLARWFLFVRSHWLRMPFYLLLPHLFRKAVKRYTGNLIK